MIRIFEWAFNPNRPMWVVAIATMLGIGCYLALMSLTIFLFATDFWYLNVIIWIAIPAWVLIKEYHKDKDQ